MRVHPIVIDVVLIIATLAVLAAASVVVFAANPVVGFLLWSTFGIVAVVVGLVAAAKHRERLARYCFGLAIGMAAATVVGFVLLSRATG